MKVRNNTNKDFQLIFSKGNSVNFSRAEISRILTKEEETDILLLKAIKNRWLVVYKEPITENIKKVEVAEKKIEVPVRVDKEEKGEKKIETPRKKKSLFGKKEDSQE